MRIPGLKYLEVARNNGINALSAGAPVILADGILGKDHVMVTSGPILGEIGVAVAIHDAPAMGYGGGREKVKWRGRRKI